MRLVFALCALGLATGCHCAPAYAEPDAPAEVYELSWAFERSDRTCWCPGDGDFCLTENDEGTGPISCEKRGRVVHEFESLEAVLEYLNDYETSPAWHSPPDDLRLRVYTEREVELTSEAIDESILRRNWIIAGPHLVWSVGGAE